MDFARFDHHQASWQMNLQMTRVTMDHRPFDVPNISWTLNRSVRGVHRRGACQLPELIGLPEIQ